MPLLNMLSRDGQKNSYVSVTGDASLKRLHVSKTFKTLKVMKYNKACKIIYMFIIKTTSLFKAAASSYFLIE